MKYSEDPLLKSKRLLLEKNVLNLYSALVKIEDFETERPLSSMPYLTGKIAVDTNHLISTKRISDFEDYIQQKIHKKTIAHWRKNNIIPFPFLRVISLQYKNPIEKLSDYITQIDGISNVQGKGNLRLPKFYKSLLSDDIIYFYGYLLGDGCISKNKVIRLCDGHPKTKYVHYSFKHLNSIQNFLKNKFNLYSKLSKYETKCYLTLVSKSFSRFLKFFYGYKKDVGFITKPEIIGDNALKSKILYRGIFDADSGIKEKDKFLTLKCKDEKFLKSCIHDLVGYGVNTSRICYDNYNTSFFKIYAHNLLNYAEHIGFHHPRKQNTLIAHLRKGCLIKKLDSINFNNMVGNFYNLSKIHDLRIKSVSDTFKEYRQELGTQEKVAMLLNTFRGNVKRWENNTNTIPFYYYFELMKLVGFTLEEVLDDLSKRTVLFCQCNQGGIRHWIKLPIIFKDSDLIIFRYLTPAKTKVVVKSYGINDRHFVKEKQFNQIEELFGLKISRDSRSYILSSTLISSFLSTFYNYTNSWNPLSEEKIAELRKSWNVII